jgi:hypothetical protein
MFAKLKKFWVETTAVAVWLWANFGPSVVAYVQAHPAVAVKVASLIGSIAVIAARLSKSSLATPPSA